MESNHQGATNDCQRTFGINSCIAASRDRQTETAKECNVPFEVRSREYH
jgi:hypothetical protein